jgi:hypothetical protein
MSEPKLATAVIRILHRSQCDSTDSDTGALSDLGFGAEPRNA